MSQVEQYVHGQVLSLQDNDQPEHEVLYLPLDFPLAIQVTLGLTSLGEHQR